jgi:hypothetical protein
LTNQTSRAKTAYRIVGALTGLFALVAQYYLIVTNGSGWLEQSIRFFTFMTIWTNIVMTLSFLVPLMFPTSRLSRFFQEPIVEGGIFVYAFIIMLIYHFFLASVWSPQGLQKLVDFLLHYAIPMLYMLYWVLFGKKNRQHYINTVKWLIYPSVYVVIVAIRGAVSNWYPYPFIDVTELGYRLALKNMALVAVAYLIVGVLFILVDRAFKMNR